MSGTPKVFIDRAAAQFSKAQKQEKNLAVHEAEARAVDQNTARLRALRLARDAADAEARKANPPPAPVKRRKKATPPAKA